MDIKDNEISKGFKRLQHERPSDAKARSVMNIEVEVDAKKQQLGKKLKAFSSYCLNIPSLMSPEAQIFMQLLMSVFEKQKEVREGILKDIIFGFASAGVPVKLSMTGAIECFKQGYLEFRGPDNSVITRANEIPTNVIEFWVIYTPKLLNMVYESGPSTGIEQVKANEVLSQNFSKEINDEGSSLK